MFRPELDDGGEAVVTQLPSWRPWDAEGMARDLMLDGARQRLAHGAGRAPSRSGGSMRRHLKLAVSALDAYKWWAIRETSTLPELADRLCFVGPPTEAMLVGRAFEAALFGEETAGYEFHGRVERIEADARQAWLSFELAFDDWTVELRGRIDGLNADEVLEIKTTGSGIDLERYATSPQWRCYLIGTGMERCRYEVFQVCRAHDHSGYDVRDHRTIVLRRYEHMEADIREATENVVRAVSTLIDNGLLRLDHKNRLQRV